MRSRLIPMVAAGFLIAGFAHGTHRDAMATCEVAPDPTPLPPTVSQLFPKTEPDAMLWPLNRAHVWQINRYNAAVE